MLAAALLALGCAAVFYIIIGYPLLLAFYARRGAPVKKDLGHRPAVSVVVAVHNGAAFLSAKLQSILELDYPADRMEIIVASDGSTDDTDSVVESFAGRGVRLLRLPRGGKAAALNAAVRECAGEIVFFTDARQKLGRDALARIAANFADPSVGAVSGELRYLNPDRAGEQADIELYWRYEVWARGRHSEIDSIFGATGCIYAARRDLLAPIPPDTLSDDVLIPIRIFLRGFRVLFEAGALAFDYPTAEGEFRRKVRTLAGLWQVFARTPRLFAYRRMRWHFLSHKFARVLLPWAVLLVYGSTLALPPSGMRTLLLAGEAAAIALALLDAVVPKHFPLKRITSPARSFFAMNAAALLSIIVFFVSPETLWRKTRVKVRR